MSRDIKHLVPSQLADNLKQFQGVIRPGSSSYRLEFINGISERLFWRTSTGVTVIEPEGSPSTEEYFYIQVEYEFDIGHRFDVRELVQSLTLPKTDPVYKEILDKIKYLEQNPGYTAHRKFSYTLGVSRDDLLNAGGAVYLKDLDIVVGLDRYRDDILHPYSSGGLARAIANQVVDKQEGLTYNFVFVDNTLTRGSLWLNTWFDVLEIKTTSNPQLVDGIYVTRKQMGKRDPEVVHYPLEVVQEKLGLFPSRSEAEAFGRPDAMAKADALKREQELAEFKHAVQMEKVQLDREKEALDREKEMRKERIKEEDAKRERDRKDDEARRERERKEHDEFMKREREQIDLQRERLKHEWQYREMNFKFDADSEKRSHDTESLIRKERSEYFKGMIDVAKGALGLVTVGLSIYAALQKTKK